MSVFGQRGDMLVAVGKGNDNINAETVLSSPYLAVASHTRM